VGIGVASVRQRAAVITGTNPTTSPAGPTPPRLRKSRPYPCKAASTFAWLAILLSTTEPLANSSTNAAYSPGNGLNGGVNRSQSQGIDSPSHNW